MGGEIKLFTLSITDFAQNIVVLMRWQSQVLKIRGCQDKDGLCNLLLPPLWKSLLCSSAEDCRVKTCGGC